MFIESLSDIYSLEKQRKIIKKTLQSLFKETLAILVVTLVIFFQKL